MKKWLWNVDTLSLVLFISAYSIADLTVSETANVTAKKEKATATAEQIKENIKEFTLTAKEANWEIKSDLTIPIWGFAGEVPGPQIRVKEGDKVRITLKNELPDPTTSLARNPLGKQHGPHTRHHTKCSSTRCGIHL